MSAKPSQFVFLIGAIAVCSSAFVANAAETGKQETRGDAKIIDAVLAQYLASVGRIQNYDVVISQTVTPRLKVVFVEQLDPANPQVTVARRWAPLDPGDKPIVHESKIRQVSAQDGRERIEAEHSHGPPRELLAVNDGVTLRTLSKTAGAVSGSVRDAASRGVPTVESYSNYLRGSLADLARVLRNLGEHSGMRLLSVEEGKDAEHLAAIAMPDSESHEFRVWFDARHGQLPVKVESWREELTDAGPVLISRREVGRFHEVLPGVWAPVEITVTSFSRIAGNLLGQPTSVSNTMVDVSKSRWNVPLDEELFELKFAPGTEVFDQIDELQLTAGDGDDGHSLELLLRNATQKRKIAPPVMQKRFELAKVRAEDAPIAKLLLNYDAMLSLDESGAVTHVAFDPLQAAKDRGGYAPVIDNALLPKIAQLEKLEYLGLNHTQVTDEGLKELSGHKHLKRLSLQGTRISDEGLKNLEPLASLEGLWLDNTLMSDGKPVKSVSLTDAGLAHLAKLPNLTHLYITNTDVTDAGLAHLKSLARLEQVSLKGTAVTAEGIAATKAAMPGLQRME
jgi:hypothetical protein